MAEEALETAAFSLAGSSADFVSGGVAGMAGVVAGAPLDTVRVRQQQPTMGRPKEGAFRLLHGMLKREGFTSLFRGMSYPMSTAAVQNAICFEAYEVMARYLGRQLHSSSHIRQNSPSALPFSWVFWSGCFAGAVQTVIVTPIDLLKIRLQLQTARPGSLEYVGPLRMLRLLMSTEGIPALYRGTVVTALRDIPSHGVYFAAFEGLREYFDPGSRSGTAKSSEASIWAAGGIAGAVSWLVIYPLDVVKSRIQATTTTSAPFNSWIECMSQSVVKEGPGILVRGLGSTLTRAFLVNSAIFSVYEYVHHHLQQH
jgi:solute carrier family 25 carnitine/acylcarnitine transporter 20/29